ncbi:MAG: tetratricopeptide repeat protein [Anaerolineae bacterium]|nr:tetratricopeptide repeat protein [Anaerolineae bacterium]
MNGGLDHLTEADIRARCTEASFERGWSYYTGGAVRQRTRLDDGIETRVAGTHIYRVTIREAPGRLVAFCTCPYDCGSDCKHIVATLLAWLHEPDSFRQSLAAARDAGDRQGEGQALTNLGLIHKARGELDEALNCYQTDAAICEGTGDKYGLAAALLNCALIHADRGDWEAVHQEAADDNVRTLTAVHEALISRGIEVTLNQVDNALERLVDLRNILQRTAEGYEFAVAAFPEVIAKTARLDDLIALNRETYQHHGDVEPRSKRGVS